MQFVIHFEDEIFVGNPLGSRESGWLRLPEKPILVLEYILPYGDSLALKNYEEYLHMVECVQPVGHESMIEHVYIMGKRNGLVTSYRITILQRNLDDRYKVGDITVRVFPDGKEYSGGSTKGWKKGLVKK